MRGLRTFLLRHRVLAAMALALALSVRLLVPSGFMIASDARVLTVVICSGVTGAHETAQIVIPQSGQKSGQGNGPGGRHDAGKTDPCPYSSLAMASTGAAAAPLLATAMAFILALGFAPVASVPRERVRHFRPPLRGPPVLA